jgi:hypothetical protein
VYGFSIEIVELSRTLDPLSTAAPLLSVTLNNEKGIPGQISFDSFSTAGRICFQVLLSMEALRFLALWKV